MVMEMSLLFDIFVVVRDEEQLRNLRMTFEMNSDLKFTYELCQNRTLPFLDILVQAENNSFVTKVYRKPTDVGESPERRQRMPKALQKKHNTCSRPTSSQNLPI
jgi:hypothetical protein